MSDEKQSKFSVAIKKDAYQNLINETLGDKETAKTFVAEISTVVANNSSLALCDAGTILAAGLTAQTLRLPLSPTLGFAYIVPYGNKAQFQIGWKGLVQLAQRTGQYKYLGVREVHEGEYVGQDKFGEDKFHFSHEHDSKPVVGYLAYFGLLNGFEKSLYWTKEQSHKHGKKFSKSYGTGKTTDLWTNSFDDMSKKTVLKQLLSKWGPMSVELEKAVVFDQAVIDERGNPNYVDNDDTPKIPEKKTTVKNTILEPDADGVVEEKDTEIAEDFTLE